MDFGSRRKLGIIGDRENIAGRRARPLRVMEYLNHDAAHRILT